MHALKYSAVKSPDGMIYHLHRPMVGRWNDNALLYESGLLHRCKQFSDDHYIFGDPAYPKSDVLLSPYDKIDLLPDQITFNLRMSAVHESVEWEFADIIQLWASLNLVSMQKLFLNPIGIQFRVCTLLTNIHTCIYGSQASHYFNCCPPSLDRY
jgi:hypothetical protein